MKKILIALPAVALLAACGSKAGGGGGGSSSDIHIVGSSTVYPFTKAVAEQFMRANPGINVTVESTGTGAGMQQAARVSQRTAFFHLGELVEYGKTSEIFTNPRQQRTQDYITGRYG